MDMHMTLNMHIPESTLSQVDMTLIMHITQNVHHGPMKKPLHKPTCPSREKPARTALYVLPCS
jgi:hypothetical protein